MANGIKQGTPVDSIRDVVRSSLKVPEFEKHLKKAGGHIGRNAMELAIKMMTIVRKTLMIEMNELHLSNLDNMSSYFEEGFSWVRTYFPTVVSMSCPTYFDSLWDGR